MSETQTSMTTDECTFDLVFAFMLPMFLASAGGNVALARTTIVEMLIAYQAASPAEIELVARIIAFGHVAMDSLRQSMRPDLPDSAVLRHRNTALAMNRAAEQCTKTLERLQARSTSVQASRSLPPQPRPPMPEMPKPPVPRMPAPPPQPKPEMRQPTDAEIDGMLAELAAMHVRAAAAGIPPGPGEHAAAPASHTHSAPAPAEPVANQQMSAVAANAQTAARASTASGVTERGAAAAGGGLRASVAPPGRPATTALHARPDGTPGPGVPAARADRPFQSAGTGKQAPAPSAIRPQVPPGAQPPG